jgi:hypothetical protein
MSLQIRLVKIADLDLTFQGPEHLDQDNVEGIAAAMLRGEKIGPIIVYRDGKIIRLWDGFHRVAAAKSVGRKRLEAEIRIGGRAVMLADGKRGLGRMSDRTAKHLGV